MKERTDRTQRSLQQPTPLTEPLEPRLLLSVTWPVAPFYGLDVYVNQWGDATVSGQAIDPAGDHDPWRVWFDNDGAATFETTGVTDTEMAFYDGPGGPDIIDDDSGSGHNARIITGVSMGSLYWLDVAGYNDVDTGAYDMVINGPQADSSKLTIDYRTVSASSNGTIDAVNDYDFFSFWVPWSGLWTVTVDPQANLDATFNLYNGAGDPVGGTFTSTVDGFGDGGIETWSGWLDYDGYHFRVDGFGASQGGYAVSVQGPEDDPYEPNSTLAEAWDFTGGDGSYLYLYGGSLASQKDDDFYEITIPPDYERLVVSLKFQHAAGDIDLALYDEFGTLVTTVASATNDEVLRYLLPTAGTYYLKVFGDNTGNSYNLFWNGMEREDFYEPNDLLAEAWDFTGREGQWLSSYGQGWGVQKNDDWYEVTITPGYERLLVDLEFTHAEGDIDLAVYDEGGTLVTTAASNTDDESLDCLLPAAGTYYLKVFGDNAANLYDLRWEGTEREDPYEPNNTLAQAWDFTGGECQWLSSYGGSLGVQADEDWYKVYVDATRERLIVDLRFTHADGDIDLAVYDWQGEFVTHSTSQTDNESIDCRVPSYGTYYLRVYFGNAGNTYDLWWDDAIPLDDPYEPNDLLAEAWDFTGGAGQWLSSYGGAPGIQEDEDWYRIDVAPGHERLTVDLTFTHADGDIDLALYDGQGEFVTHSTSMTDNETIDCTLAAPGTYYLWVYFGNTGNTYDLRWETIELVPPVMPVRVDAWPILDVHGDLQRIRGTEDPEDWIGYAFVSDVPDAAATFTATFDALVPVAGLYDYDTGALLAYDVNADGDGTASLTTSILAHTRYSFLTCAPGGGSYDVVTVSMDLDAPTAVVVPVDDYGRGGAGGSLTGPTDLNYFRFTAPRTAGYGRLMALGDGVDPSLLVQWVLWDETTGTECCWGLTLEGGAPFGPHIFTAQALHEYVLSVSALNFDGGSGNYDLTVAFSVRLPGDADYDGDVDLDDFAILKTTFGHYPLVDSRADFDYDGDVDLDDFMILKRNFGTVVAETLARTADLLAAPAGARDAAPPAMASAPTMFRRPTRATRARRHAAARRMDSAPPAFDLLALAPTAVPAGRTARA